MSTVCRPFTTPGDPTLSVDRRHRALQICGTHPGNGQEHTFPGALAMQNARPFPSPFVADG
jgi:hypothetical protein